MQVQAKCLMDAFDSPSCQHFKMGSTYEIDRDGPLAQLKTSGGKLGKFVFEFDRNANPTDKPHDYSCKKCDKKFKTLPALGSHMNADHKDESSDAESDEEEVVVAVDQRGKRKGGFTCKTPGCGVTVANLHLLKVHKKTHEKAAVEQAA